MPYWLEFFESCENSYNYQSTCTKGPVIDEVSKIVWEDFEKYVSVRKAITKLRNCLKFALIMDEKEKKLLFETRNLDEAAFEKFNLTLPENVELLKLLVMTFPKGMARIHDLLFNIVDNDSYHALGIIDKLPENLYFQVKPDSIKGLIEDSELNYILHNIESIYGRCQNIYNYHKKNNWDVYNPNFDDVGEDPFEITS